MDKKEVKGRKKAKNSKTKKEVKNKSKAKIQIKDKRKFAIGIALIIAIIVIVILLIVLNKKADISNVSDFSTLNTSKYSDELLAKYQTEESKNKFLEDYDLVQGAVGVYIITNSTTDEDSFTKLLNQLTDILKKEEFSKLSIDKPSFWNGEWQIDDQGIVKFKFGSKNITPSWVNDEELINKIVE